MQICSQLSIELRAEGSLYIRLFNDGYLHSVYLVTSLTQSRKKSLSSSYLEGKCGVCGAKIQRITISEPADSEYSHLPAATPSALDINSLSDLSEKREQTSAMCSTNKPGSGRVYIY